MKMDEKKASEGDDLVMYSLEVLVLPRNEYPAAPVVLVDVLDHLLLTTLLEGELVLEALVFPAVKVFVVEAAQLHQAPGVRLERLSCPIAGETSILAPSLLHSKDNFGNWLIFFAQAHLCEHRCHGSLPAEVP